MWQTIGLLAIALALVTLVLGAIRIAKNASLSWAFVALSLLGYLPLYVYSLRHSFELIPFSIPRWMVLENPVLYVSAYFIPTLLHGLLILVHKVTPETKQHYATMNFLYTIGVPLLCYLFMQIGVPILRQMGMSHKIMGHVMELGFIVSTVLFIFFLLRWIFLFTTRNSDVWKENPLLYKIPLGLLLPIIGLFINQGLLETNMPENIFGDFSHWSYYALAAANGLLICMSNPESPRLRLLLFVARSITFSFTFYFTLVFIPYIPLALVAVMALGLGFVMLTPIFLFFIHTSELLSDLRQLQSTYPKSTLRMLGLLSFLLLPMIITFKYHQHKMTLSHMLEAQYHPDYTTDYAIDRNKVGHLLSEIRSQKQRDALLGLSPSKTPYLSSYYNWYVMDNLTLSDQKINDLEHLYFGVKRSSLTFQPPNDNRVTLTDYVSTTTYDPESECYRSQIDLTMTNSGSRNAEYATFMDMPQGTVISDYYLYVGDRKEPGILAERKAALWVYNQIRSVRKDPGILYYTDAGKIALRVFPFTGNEVRKTGFTLLHKEPFTLTIDGKAETLGSDLPYSPRSYRDAQLCYLSSAEKRQLPQTYRTPYLHFLLNNSDSTAAAQDYSRLMAYLEAHPQDLSNAKISLVDVAVSTHDLAGDWTHLLRTDEMREGYNLNHALKKSLYLNHKESPDSYPVHILISDPSPDVTLDADLAQWRFTFPEGSAYYAITEDLTLIQHDLMGQKSRAVISSHSLLDPSYVYSYKTAGGQTRYLPRDEAPALILETDELTMPSDLGSADTWLAGIYLHAAHRQHLLHPRQGQEDWLSTLRVNFEARVLTPLTTFMVVENEAQKAMLIRKQKQIMAANKALDAGETVMMSEPQLLWILMPIFIYLMFRRRAPFSFSFSENPVT